MSYNLSPVFQTSQFADDGTFLIGGRLYWYLAGTTTPATTYRDNTGGASQTNPIVLDARGEPAYPIWLASGQSYKAVLCDADDVELKTIDDIVGINDAGGGGATVAEWLIFGAAPTYVDATNFSVAGDQRSTFQVYRRVRAEVGATTLYGTISASAYSAGITTVTVAWDSGSLNSGVTSVAVGILGASNQSIPSHIVRATTFDNAVTITGAATCASTITATGLVTANAGLTAKTDIVVDTSTKTESAEMWLNSPSGSYGEYFNLQHNSILRWLFGNHTDDKFIIHRHNSSGVYVDRPFEIDPTTGAVSVNGLFRQYGQGVVSGGGGLITVTLPVAYADKDSFLVNAWGHERNGVSLAAFPLLVYVQQRVSATQFILSATYFDTGAFFACSNGAIVNWETVGELP